MATEAYERHIPFEGCYNFRDLGGYRTRDGHTVKWRTIFRSSELCLMTEADAAHAIDNLGINTVIDLRNGGEIETRGVGPLIRPPIQYHNIRVLEDASGEEASSRSFPDMGAFYQALAKRPDFGKQVVQALEIIADGEAHPVVFHCTAGKDRTGILSVALLGVLGVPDQVIIEDYSLTQRYFGALLDRWYSDPKRAEGLRRNPPSHALAEYMEGMIAALNRDHGSIRGYVEAQGGDAGLMDRLREMLLT
jgi:protein-tyrosine phosphatase